MKLGKLHIRLRIPDLFASCFAVACQVSFPWKIPLGKFLASTLYVAPFRVCLVTLANTRSMVWVVILACHVATANFAGLMVVGFLLGLKQIFC